MSDETFSGSTGRAAAKGTAYSFVLKIISFILSQLTFRFVDPVALGRASIRLELLLSTSLFIGREGFRLALLKTDSKTKSERNQEQVHLRERCTNNVSWLSIPVGGILSFVAFLVHMYSCYHMTRNGKGSDGYEDDQSFLDYQMAGIYYCVAAFVETLAEPLVIKIMQDLDVETRAAAEGSATLVKAITTVALLNGSRLSFLIPASFAQQWPVSAFGIAQLVYSVVFTSVVYKRKWKTIIWPSLSIHSKQNNFDVQALKLASIFSLQGVLKHALTEGDRIVLTALADGYDQGVYAMASSYGGMASRLLLQPLEENARLLFSSQDKKMMAQIDSLKKVETNELKTNGIYMPNDELERTLCVLLKLVLYIGLLFSCVASNYTNILLTLLAGDRWGRNDEASRALSAFCIYTALLALNGTTEAFVYGVAKSGKDVGQLGLAHAFVGMIFALTSPVLVKKWGTVGLVAANGLGMSLRSIYSIYYASTYFWKCDQVFHPNDAKSKKRDVLKVTTRLIKQFSPHPIIIVCFLGTYVITLSTQITMQIEIEQTILRMTKTWLMAAIKHVSIGLLLTSCLTILAIGLEHDFKRNIRIIFRQKKD